jgi:hypothetical protein
MLGGAQKPSLLGDPGVHNMEHAGLTLTPRLDGWLSRVDEGRTWQGLALQFSANECAVLHFDDHGPW